MSEEPKTNPNIIRDDRMQELKKALDEWCPGEDYDLRVDKLLSFMKITGEWALKDPEPSNSVEATRKMFKEEGDEYEDPIEQAIWGKKKDPIEEQFELGKRHPDLREVFRVDPVDEAKDARFRALCDGVSKALMDDPDFIAKHNLTSREMRDTPNFSRVRQMIEIGAREGKTVDDLVEEIYFMLDNLHDEI